ncbi:MAG: ATP pyrophosphatase [Desulfurella sp.]
MKAVSFFSGGKDGLFATYLAQKNSIDVKYFLLLKTTIGLSPHYENLDALKLIAHSCKKELLIFDMANKYTELYLFLQSLDVDMIISGDIYLESHYEWLKDLANKSHKDFLEPLWQQNSTDVVQNMLNSGFSYTIIACNKSHLSKNYLGYNFTENNDLDKFIKNNPGIDKAGEAGEFHTIVTNCPLYDKPFKLVKPSVNESEEYFYLKFGLE